MCQYVTRSLDPFLMQYETGVEQTITHAKGWDVQEQGKEKNDVFDMVES